MAMNKTMIGWMFVVLAGLQTAQAAVPAFRHHVVNADSTFPACAVFDVDGDGAMDIVSGGWWYRAPNWDKHFLREVEEIRGRFDDYSNLPLDVNGDGRLDIISANYRSSRIYWTEHPGDLSSPWPLHEVAMPGPMETARLVDIDGDGRLDVLPNGTKFAAWWELVPGKPGSIDEPSWRRHELPEELAAHGLGVGDIDGDGRADVVGSRGWAQAPVDRRGERWVWQPEFELHRDASIPIIIHDFDGDGDNDIAWGRGHRTGLYWLEQVREEATPSDSSATNRSWVMHVIDTSWSQAHSLMLGDLDNDGHMELVAGKRFLGHDGKDLGEYDPLQVCAYQFDRDQKVWQRSVLSFGKSTGCDLDPKLADLDGDGDLDVICPGRSGLYWLENLLETEPDGQAPTPIPPGATYENHKQILSVKGEQGRLEPIHDAADWGEKRSHILGNLQRVMGPLPDSSRRVPLAIQVDDESETSAYTRRKISFAVEPGERASAYVLIPRNSTKPMPGMLCLHRDQPAGKDEPAGLGGDSAYHYAHHLAMRGYVCVVPDAPSFGETPFSLENSPYESGLMKAVWNHIRALDVLESLPEVHRDKIGVFGQGLGGTQGLLAAVFDPRISTIVVSSGFTALGNSALETWSEPRMLPRIRTAYSNRLENLPFDFHEVLAAVAPRPVFINAPQYDGMFDFSGVQEIVTTVEELYALLVADGDLVAIYPESPLGLSEHARTQIYDWLRRQLR